MDTLIQDIVAEHALPWRLVLTRLVGALVLAGLIGLEREADGRPAGLRTHMLVGLAACVYCLITLYLARDTAANGEQVSADPIRVVEAVTQGVAFLAAGMIVFARGRVRGLTTGASLWLAAAIGLAVGFGLWILAVMTTILALIVIRVVMFGEKAVGTDGAARPGGEER